MRVHDRKQTTGMDLELVDGLTVWGTYGGAQIRTESRPKDPDGDVLTDDLVEETCLYVAMNPDAYRSTEDGRPWRLNADDARRLRDLLNVATARGFL